MAFCLLLLSVFTTLSTGAVLMYNFRRGAPPFAVNAGFFPFAWIVRHPDLLSGGWSFALTLLGILAAHEIGHFFACRAHGVRSSLPWVLPAPTLIGTFGAFIRLRSRVPSRMALLDIGVAGPLAGMVVAIPALISGLLLSQPTAAPGFQSSASISVSVPFALSIVHGMVRWFYPGVPPLDASFNPHPVLVAAWIGLFITSVNLMPAGQLDGGHILYAVSPRVHRWATNTIVFLLFFAGTMFWVGWLVWGCFLLPSLKHPAVAEAPLTKGRMWLAFAGLVLFALTFTLEPFAGGSLMNLLHN
ncbi:MAG TPA: site-2 protease family protein [Acidobacteriaceae bacterium]|nr:site-2 protease family protein [Acidobacteriaceae bacterium]